MHNLCTSIHEIFDCTSTLPSCHQCYKWMSRGNDKTFSHELAECVPINASLRTRIQFVYEVWELWWPPNRPKSTNKPQHFAEDSHVKKAKTNQCCISQI